MFERTVYLLAAGSQSYWDLQHGLIEKEISHMKGAKKNDLNCSELLLSRYYFTTLFGNVFKCASVFVQDT